MINFASDATPLWVMGGHVAGVILALHPSALRASILVHLVLIHWMLFLAPTGALEEGILCVHASVCPSVTFLNKIRKIY